MGRMMLWYHAVVSIVVLTWMQHASSAIGLATRPRACHALRDPRHSVLSATRSPTDAASRPPLKAMLFVDGSWLFYSMVAGRGSAFGDPISRELGPNWRVEYKVDWRKFPQIIADSLRKQLLLSNAAQTDVEVVKTAVFTSIRPGTPSTDVRVKLIHDFQAAKFEVHKYDTMAAQEKCVDISLATEMLYMSTVPGALDIAVMVSGDKDFIPAMQKTRLLGKKVALCSMKSNCNTQLGDDSNKDFPVIWLDQHVKDLYIRRYAGITWTPELELTLLQAVIDILRAASSPAMSTRDIGRRLLITPLTTTLTASQGVKLSYGSLVRFLAHYPELFSMCTEDDKAFDVELTPSAATSVLSLSDVHPLPLTQTRSVSPQSPLSSSASSSLSAGQAVTNWALRDAVVATLAERDGSLTSNELGRLLQQLPMGSASLLGLIKDRFGFMRKFLEHFSSDFQVGPLHGGSTAFVVNLLASSPAYLAWQRANRERLEEAVVPPAASEVCTAGPSLLEKGAGTEEEGESDERQDDFSKWTKVHLQELLRSRGLPVSGTKGMLIERLRR